MFGKNYDKQIETLNQRINNLQDLFSKSQDSLIKMAKIQAQHKEIISFLTKHATVDEFAQADLEKMMKNIMKINREVKDGNI